MSRRILTLPGYAGSGPGHWQTRWEASDPTVSRVVQDDWMFPDCSAWIACLGEAVRAARADVVLAAHSLGCLTVAAWCEQGDVAGVAGALLVAPPDPAGPAYPRDATGFTLPKRRLPFPTIVVASTDDPYASLEFSTRCAETWGSRLEVIGPRGHINGESGLGDWPQGWRLVAGLPGAG